MLLKVEILQFYGQCETGCFYHDSPQPALCRSSVPEHVHYSCPRRQDCYVVSWKKKNLRFWKRIHGGYSLGSAVAVTVFDALIPIASSWENFSGLQGHYLFPKDDKLISLQWWLLKFFSSQFLTQRLNIIIKKLFSEEIPKINKNTISNFLGRL